VDGGGDDRRLEGLEAVVDERRTGGREKETELFLETFFKRSL
jgi:hypothetical protein